MVQRRPANRAGGTTAVPAFMAIQVLPQTTHRMANSKRCFAAVLMDKMNVAPWFRQILSTVCEDLPRVWQHDGRAWLIGTWNGLDQAVRAAFTKARIIAASFTPGADSTPEDTSTPGAPVAAMAAVTLSGVRPPASSQS